MERQPKPKPEVITEFKKVEVALCARCIAKAERRKNINKPKTYYATIEYKDVLIDWK